MRRQAKVGTKGGRFELVSVMRLSKHRRIKCYAKAASLGDESVLSGNRRHNWLPKLEILK